MRDNIKKAAIIIIILLSINRVSAQKNRTGFELKVELKGATKADTLILELINPWTFRSEESIKSIMNDQHLFSFHVTTKRANGFWQLNRQSYDSRLESLVINSITNWFFWEKSDDIFLKIENIPSQTGIDSRYQFSGKNSTKYQLRANLFTNNELRQPYMEGFKSPAFSPEFRLIDGYDPFIKVQLKMLERDKNKISHLAYKVLKSDITYGRSTKNYNSSLSYYLSKINTKDTNEIQIIKNNYFETTKDLFPLPQDQGLLNSTGAFKVVEGKMYSDIWMRIFPKQNVRDYYYDYIKKNTTGELRERLLIYYFNNYTQPDNMDSLIIDAGLFFKTNRGKQELKKLQIPYPRSLEKGYTFIDTLGIKINLDSLKGKTVLIDVYGGGCAPCVTLYKEVISKIKAKYQDHTKFIIVSISNDRKMSDWKKSLSTGLYTSFTANTININTGQIGRDHPFLRDNKLFSNPSVLLIDATGRTLYINNEVLFKYEKLDRILQKML